MHTRPFGQLPCGTKIDLITLRNDTGASVEILTLGGIVRALHVPDRAGRLENIVLGFRSLEPYVMGHPYFGAIAGRVAGRITKGHFNLDGQDYQLARNHHPNHLHGGLGGFHNRVWQAANSSNAADAVRLSYRSRDGEEGYPGNLEVEVTYSLTPDNRFTFEAIARTDRATPCSLTHHSYFNLAGEHSGSIADHRITIAADEFVPTDADLTLLGLLRPVEGTAADLRRECRLGDVIPHLWQQHGDLYRLRARRPDEPVARLYDPTSGRVLTVTTTEPFLQPYTGVGLPGSNYPPFAGFCLECERYPDALNHPGLDDHLVLRPGQTYRQHTTYAFSILA